MTREWQFGRLIGDFVVYPYQLSFGITLRVFDGVASLRLHLGPFKVWAGWVL